MTIGFGVGTPPGGGDPGFYCITNVINETIKLYKVELPLGVETWTDITGGGGTGTVTSVSVVTANGFSGTVANPTTTPAITLAIDNAGTVRTALGLGTAALNNTGDFDPAGAAAAAQAASQPLDADLTAIASLATDAFGRGALTQTSAANFRTYIGAGTGGGDALVANPLSQFAATTSAQLAGVLSDETGTGLAVFNTSPTLVTPLLGTPTSGVLTNCTGTASGLTAGNVTTNANLTGPITSVGNATAIASQTGTGTTFAMSVAPTFTGVPAAPTATPGTNTTQLATTAFVTAAVAAGGGGGVTGANPSDSIAGPAINGVATTYMRSDAVPALASVITQPETFQVTNSGTTSVTVALSLSHHSTGTPAAGFGVAMQYLAHDDAGSEELVAADLASWVSAVSGNSKGRRRFFMYDVSARECLRLEANGAEAMIGFLGSPASAQQVSPDIGTALVTFGLVSGTPTFAGGNITGTVPLANVASSANACTGNSATVTTNANLTGPVTSVGNATTIAAGVVTLAMQANMATGSLVYRKTLGAGAPEINTLATLKTDLGLTGTNSGDQTNITGNAATVTTNANLTGPITSVGNATSIASQTGTGTTFVMNTSPTLVTPLLGTPTSGVLTNCTGTAAGLTAGIATTLVAAPTITGLVTVSGAQDANAGQLKVLTTGTFGGISFFATNATSTNRNWQMQTNYQTAGNLDIMRSAAQGGNPTVIVMSLTSNGYCGHGMSSPTAVVDIIGSTTAASSLRIRSGTAPTAPNDGDIWYDGTNIKIRVGGTTKTFTIV